MTWISRIFRRKVAQAEQSDWAPESTFVQQDWVPQHRSGNPGEADHAALGFSSSGEGFLRSAEGGELSDRRYRHAFTPSQPVADVRRMAGRTALIKRVIRSIEDQDLHVVLFGDRGIGKTSVLKVVQGLAIRANYMVHYVSCGQSANFPEVFRSLAARIPLLFDGTVDPTAGDAAEAGSLADRLPPGDFSVSQLTEALARIEGARIIMILDEFDRSDVEIFRLPVGELIKNLSDRSIRVQLLIGGVAGNLSELIAHVPSIRRNIVGIGVPNLDEGEVGEMIDIAEYSGRVSFDSAARERLTQVSAGLPYLVGLIGQHAVVEAVEAGKTKIGPDHVNNAVEVACEDIASRLSVRCTFALDRLPNASVSSLLELAANAAVREGGVVVDTVLTQELMRNASSLTHIIEPIPEDPRGGWRFCEDGASSLVWLRYVQKNTMQLA